MYNLYQKCIINIHLLELINKFIKITEQFKRFIVVLALSAQLLPQSD